MDSNNGPSHIGIGEREGRVLSSIVNERNYGLIHGMGRSGDVTALQPKAAGSSLWVQLTIAWTKNLLHSIGMTFIKELWLLPFATGMAITWALWTMHNEKPKSKYVIWSRIDQKTCWKCIVTAGWCPIIIDPILKDGELVTNTELIKEKIIEFGVENIWCVYTTTSCFAPRSYDDVVTVGEICKANNLYHWVNNAYGIYCTKIVDMLTQANKQGRIDLIISSTDKNFMVPVGGSLMYSSASALIDKARKNYPGRASISSVWDLFISFLEMGKTKYLDLIKERKQMFKIWTERMKEIAGKYNEKLLVVKGNKISFAFTIGNITTKASKAADITEWGSLFYTRQISGIRVIAPQKEAVVNICGYEFKNYGANSVHNEHVPYLTFACAIGVTIEEIDSFTKKFPKIIEEYLAKLD